jgi:hypothetical protein
MSGSPLLVHLRLDADQPFIPLQWEVFNIERLVLLVDLACFEQNFAILRVEADAAKDTAPFAFALD